MELVNRKAGRGVDGAENSEKGRPKFVRKRHRSPLTLTLIKK